MVKIEAPTLEEAYQEAASKFRCSVTALDIEIIQQPSKGVFGFGKKNAIIIAAKKHTKEVVEDEYEDEDEYEEEDGPYDFSEDIEKHKPKRVKIKPKPRKKEVVQKRVKSEDRATKKVTEPKRERVKKEQKKVIKKETVVEPKTKVKKAPTKKPSSAKTFRQKQKELNSTIIPVSFVSDQEEEFEEEYEEYENSEVLNSIEQIAQEIEEEINELFDLSCFDIERISVTPYDETTVLVNFDGEDSALLIGKEGYRYKALSYMIFNWINAKYNVQLVLEIAEFLKNQEEAVDAYLVSVFETIESEGRAQTKILDGVLIQIALQKLRNEYPDKYIVVRSTRDGLKYIIINDYHSK